MKGFFHWLRGLLTGTPHFIVGDPERPYMLRWHLLPRNRWFCVYLHKFLQDDDDRALHDHPWWFVSIMLRGGYVETFEESDGVVRTIRRGAPSIAFRKATHRHRVTLPRDASGEPVPCWTLIVRGPVGRVWGFWCPKGFVPWFEFVKPTAKGQIGKGCGD